MRESTKKAIETIKERIGDREFYASEITEISWETFTKYVDVEKINHVHYTEWTLEEIIDRLNECSEADCSCNFWHYVIKDGKAYQVIPLIPTYKII